ncbi:hypothetical protein Pelo_18509 [Pelomyxa schiedti]|nr:hypothetical protein Pelo_18509 [Pelomyxa schiedti]
MITASFPTTDGPIECVCRATLSARDQVGTLLLAAASRGGAVGVDGGPTPPLRANAHTIARLVWSHVAATQVRLAVSARGMWDDGGEDVDVDEEDTDEAVLVCHNDGSWTAFFRVSPDLLGIVGRVEVRPGSIGRQWVDETHYIAYGREVYPRLVIRSCTASTRTRSGREPDVEDRIMELKVPDFRMGDCCANEVWMVEIGQQVKEEERTWFLLIQPSLILKGSDKGECAAIQLPYRNSLVNSVAFNKLNELIIYVSLLGEGKALLAAVDTMKSYSTRSLVVIGGTSFYRDEHFCITKSFHIQGIQHQLSGHTSSPSLTEADVCRSCGVFIAVAGQLDESGHRDEVWLVEETSGVKKVLACSTDTLRVSWISGSKFTLCHWSQPDYESQ